MRSTATPTSRYEVYSRAGQLLYVEDNTYQQASDYLHLGDTLVAQRRRNLSTQAITTTYQHADHRGTPGVQSQTDGTATRSKLQPYGTPYAGTQPPGFFTKHVADENGDLVYMQQRYYGAMEMRFWSPDPVSASVGSFNVYWYANNNPYTFVDPDGRQARSMEDHPGIQQSRLRPGLADGAVPNLDEVNKRTPQTPVPASQKVLEYVEEEIVDKVLPALGPPEMLIAGAAKLAGGGIIAVRLGRAGENAVRAVHEIGPAGFFRVGWRLRRPDGINEALRTVSEVKNVASQGLTRQLLDYMHYANSRGFQFQLFVRPGAHISRPLREAENAGRIVIREIPMP